MGSFSVSVWLMNNLISGVQRGVFAQEFAALSATDYFIKGILSAEQVEQISIEAVYTPPEIHVPETPVPEIPSEEPEPVEGNTEVPVE